MSIHDSKKIDMVATRPDGELVELVITDHLDWADIDDHCRLLHDKVSAYLHFVETGQIYALPGHDIPKSAAVQITLELSITPAPEAAPFLERIRALLAESRIAFVAEIRAPDVLPS